MTSLVPTLALAASVALSAACPGRELLVPSDHPTIAGALATAAEGDVVRVSGGTYRGNLVMARKVALLGEDGSVIEGEGKGSVITVVADGCEVRGFQIRHSGTSLSTADAGILLRGSKCRIEGNRISECLFGIYLERASGNTLRANRIEGIEAIEIGERGSGIHLYDSHRNLLEDDRVNVARDGIYFDHAGGNIVRGTSVRHARYGLHYMYSDDNSFLGDLFSDCTAGAAIMFSRRLVVEENRFIRNRGFSSVGVLLKDCYDSRVTRNLIADNSTGLVLDNSMKNSFHGNLLCRNDLALHLFSSSEENLFAGNGFEDNLSPLRVLGRRTTTRWSEGGRGNHWSEYSGFDLDGDGIGDTPFHIQDIFEFIGGEHPTLRFFLVSPAAAAMKSGEEAFPLFEFSSEVDPAPLAVRPRLELPPAPGEEQRRAAGPLASCLFAAVAGGLALAIAGLWRPLRRAAR